MSLLFALLLPAALWIVFSLALQNGEYVMDQGNHKGSFFPILALYSVAGYALFFASLVAAGFSCLHGSMWAASVLIVAAIEALLFNVALVFFYESYLHFQAAKSRSNYTRLKYATILSLALSSIMTFVAGLIMVVMVGGVDRI